MVIETTLNVPVHAFYALLVQSLYEDIKHHAPEVTPQQLCAGFTYDKKLEGMMRQQSLTKATIVSLVENKEYIGSFESQKGVTTLAYQMDGNDNQTFLRYEETFVGHKGLTNANYKLVSNFYKRRTKKRMLQLFHNMEAYLLEQKEK
ncbi:MAG: DUF3284 domain-containing protein [Erysipelotrichaceae bacterium]